ncbi:hypothetical protein [Ralstonia sp.]|uniref:hypothetical protein n=1 Tax=Ralstonia sp. TaxID=54061 RepID=UPI0031DE82E3
MTQEHLGRARCDVTTCTLPAPAGGVQLETFIPWTLVKRSLKKQIITPLDTPQAFTEQTRQEDRDRPTRHDSALARALGLAHYWQRLLEERRLTSIAQIAAAEGVDVTQVRRILRLALLAPAVIERLLASPTIALEPVIRRAWPVEWRSAVACCEELCRPERGQP